MGVGPDGGRMGRRRGNERGQAMVEFALIAPLLAIVLLGIFQLGAAFTDYITVTDAARAGARIASVDGSAYTFTQATADAVAGSNEASGHTCAADNWCTTVATNPSGVGGWAAGNSVIVTVKAPYSIDLLGFTVASGNLSHTVTMRIQQTTVAAP
jgi:Flp pilus assembly protein TadG